MVLPSAYIGFMLLLVPKLAAFPLLMLLGLDLAGCSASRSRGDTTFAKEKKGFEKELTPDQRKAAIKQLQNETSSKP
jgi:hypothetical protein